MHDIGLVGGDLPHIPTEIRDDDLIVQRIGLAISLHRGEWLEDESKGQPWLAWSQRKPAPLNEIGLEIRLVIQNTPGVLGIETFDIALDPDTRRITIGCSVRLSTTTVIPLTITLPVPVANSSAPWMPLVVAA